MPHLASLGSQVLETCFKTRPIGTIGTLARMLRCPDAETPDGLLRLADQANSLYRIAGRKRKSDGTERVLLDAKYPLKTVQARIQCMILRKVEFPAYLQGSIKKRGQGSNARCHVGRRLLITEDVESFFPATTSKVIFEVWHRFFRFPPAIADCLTKLTTKDGSLPQGAKTSPLLANIVFWQEEAKLVASFHSRGITYTRLVDDITCSSVRDMSRDERAWVIKKLRGLTASQGFRLKPGKETIAGAETRMVATKLVVNVRVAVPSEERSKIRAAVKSCACLLAAEDCNSAKIFNRVSGKLAYLGQYHSSESDRHRATLRPLRKHLLESSQKSIKMT